MRPGISVAIAAHDEERVLRACLDSVASFADEVIVVDGESADGTRDVARAWGATVIETTNKLMLNMNKNRAIDACSHEWVLVLDPDERVTPELAAELAAVARDGSVFDGYWIPRRDRELGRCLHRLSPQLRFFKRGAARFPCEHIHEAIVVTGEVGRLRGILVHEPPQGLFEYVHKRNLYSEHRARFLFERGTPFRIRRLLLRPPYAFAKSYLRHGGWREGMAGFIIAAHAAFGTFLQDAKLWQLESTRSAMPRRTGDNTRAPEVVVGKDG